MVSDLCLLASMYQLVALNTQGEQKFIFHQILCDSGCGFESLSVLYADSSYGLPCFEISSRIIITNIIFFM